MRGLAEAFTSLDGITSAEVVAPYIIRRRGYKPRVIPLAVRMERENGKPLVLQLEPLAIQELESEEIAEIYSEAIYRRCGI